MKFLDRDPRKVPKGVHNLYGFMELAAQNKLPRDFAETYGTDPEKFFVCLPELKKEYKGRKVPLPGVGLYSYLVDRIGCRKWKLDLLSRDDLMSLSKRAEEVTGIPTPDHAADAVLERILW